MSQAHGITLWKEPAGNGAAPSIATVVFQIPASDWTPVVGTAPQARLLDLTGSGTYVLTDIRGGYVPPSGTPELLLMKAVGKIRTYKVLTT